jgi:hypothetical protein
VKWPQIVLGLTVVMAEILSVVSIVRATESPEVDPNQDPAYFRLNSLGLSCHYVSNTVRRGGIVIQ